MPSARFQPSFAGGVIGPGLHGRIDISKYDVALKVGKNVFIHAHGGVSNRAGLEFIGEVSDHTKAHRLVPFKRDAEQNLVLVFGDTTMKVIEDGAFVQDGGSDYVAGTPYDLAASNRFDYVQSIDVMFLADVSLIPQKLSRNSNTDWVFTDLAVDPMLALPVISSVVSENSGSLTYTYKVAPVTGGVTGFPSAEVSVTDAQSLDIEGAKNTITWTGTADEFNVYRERNGVFGFIGFTSDLSFEDDNISNDLTTTPAEASGLFGATGEYPRAVSLYQQRLMLGGSLSEPETVWASRTGDYENFTRSRILLADDRARTDLNGQTLNTVQSLLPLRELLAFTSTGEFSLSGPNGGFPADNVIQVQYGYSGSTTVKPRVIEDTALFVDSTGRNVRDLRYAFEQDGYNGNDLTIFAAHYFENKQIAGWDFAKNPFSVLWVYLDDGTLLSLTYKREHQVWAWCEHDVGGAVESVAVIPEGNHDAVYFIVRRTIGGLTRRYIERLHSREFETSSEAFFVDSGLTYEGAPATVMTGLDHLEGETVVALADGNVVADLVVADGSVTLPRAANVVHVGLFHPAEIETLPPAINLKELGSTRGRATKASGVNIQVEKTRGIKVGGSGRRMAEIVQTGGDLSDEIGLATGMLRQNVFPDWNRDGTVVIRQDHPLPMTILGISPEYSVGQNG